MVNLLTDKNGEVSELTEEFFKQAQPASNVLADILGSHTANTLLKRKQGERGQQKAPTKKAISMRCDTKVIDYFKATGKGWQTRMNDVLLEYVKTH